VRVCHVCSGHSVDDSRVFHRACVSLAKAGYDVHLIATGTARSDGPYAEKAVTVHPLPREGRLRRLARRGRVARLAASLNPDLFHVHEPELLGPVVRIAGSRPVIWDVHESYGDVLMQRAWIPRLLRGASRALWLRQETQLLRRCAAVIAVTEQIATRYQRLHPRVRVVANYPELADFRNDAGVARDARMCVFAGLLSPARGLTQAVHALSILRSRGKDVRLSLAGPVSPADYLATLLGEAERLGVPDLVTYHGRLSKSAATDLIARAGIGLVTYLPDRNSEAGLPMKLVECMAAGIPVIFSRFANYEAVAGASHAGIAVDPENSVQIADAIEKLVTSAAMARELGENGRRAARERFNWNAQLPTLLRLYREILDAR
jgi:glycosyltransferase involved in cell wall biosynthesis